MDDENETREVARIDPQPVKRVKTGGGKKVNAMELERRVRDVHARLIEGESRASIVSRYVARGIGMSTVDRYIAQARERWLEATADEMPTIREQRVAWWRKFIKDSLRAKDPEGQPKPDRTNARLAADHLDKIFGIVDEKIHVEHSGAVAHVTLDLSSLADDELEAYERINRKLLAAGAAPALPDASQTAQEPPGREGEPSGEE